MRQKDTKVPGMWHSHSWVKRMEEMESPWEVPSALGQAAAFPAVAVDTPFLFLPALNSEHTGGWRKNQTGKSPNASNPFKLGWVQDTQVGAGLCHAQKCIFLK